MSAEKYVGQLLSAMEKNPRLKSLVENQIGATNFSNQAIIQMLNSPIGGVVLSQIKGAIAKGISDMMTSKNTTTDTQAINRLNLAQLLKKYEDESKQKSDDYRATIQNDPGLVADEKTKAEREQYRQELAEQIDTQRAELKDANKDLENFREALKQARKERNDAKEQLQTEAARLDTAKPLSPVQQVKLHERHEKAKEKGLVEQRKFELTEREKGYGAYIDALNDDPAYLAAVKNFQEKQAAFKQAEKQFKDEWALRKEDTLTKATALEQSKQEYRREFGTEPKPSIQPEPEPDYDTANLFDEDIENRPDVEEQLVAEQRPEPTITPPQPDVNQEEALEREQVVEQQYAEKRQQQEDLQRDVTATQTVIANQQQEQREQQQETNRNTQAATIIAKDEVDREEDKSKRDIGNNQQAKRVATEERERLDEAKDLEKEAKNPNAKPDTKPDAKPDAAADSKPLDQSDTPTTKQGARIEQETRDPNDENSQTQNPERMNQAKPEPRPSNSGQKNQDDKPTAKNIQGSTKAEGSTETKSTKPTQKVIFLGESAGQSSTPSWMKDAQDQKRMTHTSPSMGAAAA